MRKKKVLSPSQGSSGARRIESHPSQVQWPLYTCHFLGYTTSTVPVQYEEGDRRLDWRKKTSCIRFWKLRGVEEEHPTTSRIPKSELIVYRIWQKCAVPPTVDNLASSKFFLHYCDPRRTRWWSTNQ